MQLRLKHKMVTVDAVIDLINTELKSAETAMKRITEEEQLEVLFPP